MKLTGWVTVGGFRVPVNWTLSADGVYSGPGLSASEITLHGLATESTEEVEYTDGYDDMTVVDLRASLAAVGEPIYGNKGDLITRLRAWDAAHPDGTTVVVEEVVVEDSSGDGETTDDETGDTNDE